MITFENGLFSPERIYLVADKQLVVLNKQVNGTTFKYGGEESRPLRLNEEFRFRSRLGTHAIQEGENQRAQVLVFRSMKELLRFQDLEGDDDSLFSDHEESTSVQPKKPLKLQHGSTADTCSTAIREQSSTEWSEWQFDRRKGSEPTMQTSKITNPIMKIGEYLAKRNKGVQLRYSTQLEGNWRKARMVNEYLQNEFDLFS